MLAHVLLGLATASLSSAHFILNWPPTAGFDVRVRGRLPYSSRPGIVAGTLADIVAA